MSNSSHTGRTDLKIKDANYAYYFHKLSLKLGEHNGR